MTDLARVLAEGNVRLEPFADAHVEGLRAACALDREIWQIYPFNMVGDDFDRQLRTLAAFANWVRFAAIDTDTDRVVGMTSYIDPDKWGVTEIGATYLSPDMRGTGFNGTMKRLMIDNAFAHGFRRIEFRIDTRNTRSMAAVEKLGARHEGTLRQNRITWTGYVRDTAIYGLMREEWAG